MASRSRDIQQTSLGALSNRFVASSATPPMRPPSKIRGASVVIDDNYPTLSTRFVADAPRFISARTAASLTTQPSQEFAPLNACEIIFANETTGTLVTPSKRKIDIHNYRIAIPRFEEPTSKRSKRGREKETRPSFRTNWPVKNAHEVYLDVWREIFSRSSLKFLLDARTVCKEFNTLLKKEQSIWRKCREKEFGKELPGPPSGLTEQAYADLIVGKGCQNRGCDKKDTSKVYWTFKTRLCSHCFRQKTVKREELLQRVVNVEGRSLLELLPGGLARSGRYQGTRAFNLGSREWNSTANSIFYLRRDFDALEEEYRQNIQTEESRTQISTWVSTKLDAAIKLTDHVLRIEKWEKKLAEAPRRCQEQRAQFFLDQAVLMNPPLSREVLQTMIAYHKAIEVNRPPTIKAWENLKSKILPMQPDAERLLDLIRQHENHIRGGMIPLPRPTAETFRLLYHHRGSQKLKDGILRPEQEFVKQLARESLSNCTVRGIADADLVLACLKDVYDKYARIAPEWRPNGLNADGVEGPYRLTLDDARMIVDEVIEPNMERMPQRRPAVLNQFRCMGCSRKDSTKKYCFKKGFEHIFQKHAKFVGESHLYYKLYQPVPLIYGSYNRFPWYTVEWPKCLPLVPGYFNLSAEDKWDPNGEMQYGMTGSLTSAFIGRLAFDHPDILASDFAGNLVWAAEKLKKTKLGSACQTRISLKYALDRYALFSIEKPSLDIFADSIPAIQAVNPKMDFRFCCGICSRDDGHRGAKYVKHAVPWHDLRRHWDTKQWHKQLIESHVGYPSYTSRGGNKVELDWTTQMMLLPDDVETWDAMVEADEKLRAQKEAVRLREEKRELIPRMRGDPKAGVVLGFEEALDVFQGLFVVQ